jgi:hypothetical protein
LWEAGKEAQPFCKIATSFSGGAEEGGAGGPTHLECSRDHKADFLRWLAWELREDIAELFFLVRGDTHSPETVFDVQFAKQDGPFRSRP